MTRTSYQPTEVYDSYWRFAVARQSVLMKRLAGASPPWTDDQIIATHRFTNVYRATDRVSQYLISDVIYGHGRSNDPDEVFARILLFKFFNRIDTWREVERALGPFVWKTLDRNRLADLLDEMKASGKQIYSAAYIMPSPAYGFSSKHRNHLALLGAMMDSEAWRKVSGANSLEQVYDLLLKWPGLGPFLAFQYAIDLNYSTLMDFDEQDFVVAGPGAHDGIAKCFENVGRGDSASVIMEVCASQESEFQARGLHFPYLEGRRLQPIDCQNLFCEISKYARIAHPERPGLLGRTRIKQAFNAAPRTLPPLTLPPKWLRN